MEQNKNKKTTPIELHSEDFQEVLGSMPQWTIRWGIIIITVIVLLLITGSAFFKYPDIITANVELTGEQPIVTIATKANGKLHKLYIKNNQQVKAGDYLAMIENDAQIDDIIYLQQFLNTEIPERKNKISLPKQNISLGNMQSLYSSYYTTLATYQKLEESDYYMRKKEQMYDRIRKYEHYTNRIKRQKEIIKEQLVISQEQYKNDSSLYTQRLTTDIELKISHNKYIQALISYESIESNLEKQQIQISLLQEALYDIENQHTSRKEELKLRLKSLKMQLQAEIHKWETTYILKSPIDGKVAFTDYWTQNQNISKEKEIFNIIPDNNGKPFAKALLSTKCSGKVKKDQQVNIRFNNFPDTEFGIVNGKIRNISLTPTKIEGNSYYVVYIDLPKGLHTSYRKKLPFIMGMEGQADIITEDFSLLERILQPIKKIVTEEFKTEGT